SIQILDVREPNEFADGHIPGSVPTPWHDIDSIPEGIDPSRPVATVCGSGRRAGIAASMLQRLGADDVMHVPKGGVIAWGEHDWPIENGA
ncbi:MAG: rhodanese-like domain-containing protein, partial [Solirubrobacterales bacterium]